MRVRRLIYSLIGLLPPWSNLTFFGPSDCMAGDYGCDFKTRYWSVTVHVAVAKSFRQWGYREEWYDGAFPSFGLGPLLKVCAFEHLDMHKDTP